MSSKFVYVTYISTTREKLWEALTTPEFQKAYWFGVAMESKWEKGAPWTMSYPDGKVTDTGEVIEIEKPSRLVLKWRNEFRPELKAEGWARCTYTIEQAGSAVKLTISHESDVENSKLIAAVSGGWPMILSNLKSLLETGKVLEGIR